MALITLATSAFVVPASAAEMTFQIINDTDRSLNYKLFSRGESLQQWPSKTKAYSINPDAAVQQLKISCEAGEEICWGAWQKVQSISGEIKGANGGRDTRTTKYSTGAGDRGQRSCSHCCHVCRDGALLPVTKLRDPNPDAK
jgi:hypothetical protein